MGNALAEKNITWFNGSVTRKDREKNHGHKGFAIWFTGLSASGKSTISHCLEKLLHDLGCSTYVFDGDNVRHGLCGDLGFSREDREENIRRIGEMVNLFIDAGTVAITAFISPYKKERDRVRAIVGDDRFIEVFVDCPIKVCIERDPKGIYAKAISGEVECFTGISSPYEKPHNPDLIIKSNEEDISNSVGKIIELLVETGLINGALIKA